MGYDSTLSAVRSLGRVSRMSGADVITFVKRILKKSVQTKYKLGRDNMDREGDAGGPSDPKVQRPISLKGAPSLLLGLLYFLYIEYPMSWLHYFFVTLPSSVLYYIFSQSIEIIQTVFHAVIYVCETRSDQNSQQVRRAMLHVLRLLDIASTMYYNIMHTTLYELFIILLQTVVTIILSWISPSSYDYTDGSLSITELAELLSYEELDDAEGAELAERRMKRVMHNYVPSKPFKATIRVRTVQPHTTPTSLVSPYRPSPNLSNSNSVATEFVDTADSPLSFPCTPFSRSRVLQRSTERVDSVMFAARDKLRLEAQSASRDEYSRKAALKAQTDGHIAVFDPRQASDGLALSCGNHCALKVGRGVCCSCRSMMPVPVNTLVYIEFSITTSGNGTVPSIAIGLAPPDAPLNIMVGSWNRSLGLYSDGQMLIDSRWFQGKAATSSGKQAAGNIFTAGTTIGMLVYIPSETVAARGGIDGSSDAIGSSLEERLSSSSLSGAVINSFNRLFGLGTDSGSNTPKSSDSPNESSLITKEGSESCESSPLNKQAADTAPQPAPLPFLLQININGKLSRYGDDALAAATGILSLKAPLYPTVSLLSEDTRVWCRFCEADIVYRQRGLIGAPPEARVYCLDGSLLIDT